MIQKILIALTLLIVSSSAFAQVPKPKPTVEPSCQTTWVVGDDGKKRVKCINKGCAKGCVAVSGNVNPGGNADGGVDGQTQEVIPICQCDPGKTANCKLNLIEDEGEVCEGECSNKANSCASVLTTDKDGNVTGSDCRCVKCVEEVEPPLKKY